MKLLSKRTMLVTLLLFIGGLSISWYFGNNNKFKRGIAIHPYSPSVGSIRPPKSDSISDQDKRALGSANRGLSPFPEKKDWDKNFKASHDYYDFVSHAAKIAYEGDGRAAYYISKALQSCLLVRALYGHAADPEASLNAALAASPSWVMDAQRKTFQLCRGFLQGDAFKDLPATPEGYNKSSYWMALSYEDDDPIAQAFHAGSTVSVGNYDAQTEGSRAAFDTAQADLNNAVMAGDPAALFEIGLILSNGHGTDPLQGYALSIAACDLGYDCSAEGNPEFFGTCASAATCPSATNFQDIVTNSVGPTGYAQAYARAQQIESALARQDKSALMEFVQLKSPF